MRPPRKKIKDLEDAGYWQTDYWYKDNGNYDEDEDEEEWDEEDEEDWDEDEDD